MASSVKTPQQRASKALAKFVAGFKEGSKEPPPTRSWRNLQTLSSFDEFFKKFEKAQKEQDIGLVRAEMKVFKAALNDLISLTRAALATLKKAYEAFQKKKDKALADPKMKKVSSTSTTSALFEAVMERGVAINVIDATTILAPMGVFQPPSEYHMHRFWISEVAVISLI